MPVSTTEPSAAHHSNPAQRPGPDDPIRTIGGAHVPAAGPWDIGTGQRLGLATRGLRTQELPTRVLCGTLIVADDLLGSSLDFTLLVPDTAICICVSTRVTRLLSPDAWRADGMTTTAIGSRPASLQLFCNGVFREWGRPPSLWLTIQATVDVPELGVAVGHRRAGRLKMAADLNLNQRVASAR
jgi:hypothetical protein